MKTWFITLLLCLTANFALAQVPQRLLETAQNRSSTVQSAENELEDAVSKLARTNADPLSTKREQLDAEQEVRLARVGLQSARLELRQALTREILAWQEARSEVRVVAQRLEVAEQTLRATRLRFQNGAVNALEVARAEDSAKSAAAEVQKSQQELSTAASVLQRRIGTLPPEIALEPTPRLVPQTLFDALPNHPRVVQAKIALEKAQFDLRVKDNEFSPQAEITQAKNAVRLAEKRLEDAQQVQRLAIQNALEAWQNSQSAIASRERAVTVAQEDLRGQQARFERGLVAKLSVQNSQIALESARNALQSARNAVLRAFLEVVVSASVDLWAK